MKTKKRELFGGEWPFITFCVLFVALFIFAITSLRNQASDTENHTQVFNLMVIRHSPGYSTRAFTAPPAQEQKPRKFKWPVAKRHIHTQAEIDAFNAGMHAHIFVIQVLWYQDPVINGDVPEAPGKWYKTWGYDVKHFMKDK